MGSIEGYRAVENNFTVTVTKEEVVAAVLPLQEHWLPLSNLDLLLPPLDVGVFFCYDKPAATGTAVVGALKKGLAEALVSFYALAGEVVTNSVDEPELLCNNRGVDFVEAEADVELRSLDLYNPDDSIEGKLVPQKKNGVLAIQATFLRCGGIVVACSFDHRIADAYSANMFLVSWAHLAQLSQSAKPTISTLDSRPCFRRSLLSPRRPGVIHPSIDRMFVPVSELPPPKQPSAESLSDPVISRIYYITADQLNHIQSLANSSASNVVGDGVKRTKLESFCAFLWRMVAASANSKRVITKMGIVVDGRRRLSDGRDKQKASLMGSYFGNVLSIPYGEESARELTGKSLSWVADKVHEFLEDALTEEHFLGLVDWVEAHRPGGAVASIYVGGGEEGEEDESSAFVVSSGQRFPEEKVDFGWGRPVFGSYHFPWGGDAGYVMPMPSPVGKGDWVVYMHLRKGQLEKIESEAGQVFRPLTWDYLLH
ncbi:shikimate O-hydroxycinnamoyltransferase-like [Neltuma alba]|uniref:shikimate O-hydroxycinnamoyltransferase-like n=1 Tax=Neltuma alba TaxID=207710 RepID=UPI0010A4FFB0|nr:shikimate O-hydroxycinnamoyltransferase-like [Prosopis alba]